jgi:cytochrome c oxidase subunit 2
MNFPVAPPQASDFAVEVDNIFYALCGLTLFFTVVVLAVMLFLAVRYRRGSKYSRKGAVDEHLLLELSWSVGPLIIAIGMFLWAAKPFTEVYRPPTDAKEVFVIGKRWMWHLQHTNGIRENNELHIPVGRAVKLTMISQDVIHGFFVPAFRVKRDVLPGRYNTVWFQPTRPGKYHLFCSEYCGTNHSEMGGWVYVMEPTDYQQWEDTGGTRDTHEHETLASQGESLYSTLGCANCHAANNNVHGPTLYGLYGKLRQFKDGSSGIADDNYLRTSLISPSKQVVKGYQDIMPAYPTGQEQGQLTEEQVLSLVAYIKTLGATTPSAPAPAPPGKNGTQTGQVSIDSRKQP